MGVVNRVAKVIMKANGEVRLANVACRVSPKRTFNRILMKSRKEKYGKLKWGSGFAACFCFLLSWFLILPSFAQTNLVTPAQYLASQPKPNFASGTRLPLLTTFAWPWSYSNAVAFASGWGYALNFGTYNTLVNGGLRKDLTNSSSVIAQELALISNNPGKFRLQVDLDRTWPTNLSTGFWSTNAAGLAVVSISGGGFALTNANGMILATNRTYNPIVSPEAGDGDLSNEAAFLTAPLKTIVSNAPIAIILNGGERDLGVVGYNESAWTNDVRVLASAVYTNVYPQISSQAPSSATNGESWPDYISQRKAHQLSFLSAAVRSAVPNRQLYIFYNTGNEQARFDQPGEGSWEDVWANWGWNSLYMNINATDLPSFQDYYAGGSSWTNATGTQWNQITDLLSQRLDAVGYNFTIGATNDYAWVCGGWSNNNTNRLADISLYTGYLKCIYTSGTVGAVAGYFSYPTGTVASIFGEGGFDGTFPTNTPPHWLLQIMALAHVHALFSHLDNFLYNGDLLSGPQSHVMSLDQPAYEFTNTAGFVNDRVLVRRLRGTNSWIVTAWAADGITNNVTVTIPSIGNLTVTAVPSASVYQVTMSGTNVQQTLLDEYNSYRPAPVVGLRVVPP